MKRLLLIIGLLLLFATEILRVYFIMPFPGSQHANTIDLAYFIHKYRIILRLIGLALVLVPLYAYLIQGRTWSKLLLSVVLIFYGIIFYYFNFRFEADKMFYQPTRVAFASAATSTIPADRLVIGVVINKEAKAYPIQIIGYHHQVRDTVGGSPVMITYCTVCRTGRVFSPAVNGKEENFRLVGMDHFNAMFEDAGTKSWWQQATGRSIAGPLKNTQLTELPSSQSTLREWMAQYPDTRILQPDTLFKKDYEDLADYDKGTIKGGLERRDSASWKKKSWVVGVRSGHHTKAYDWNDLVSHPLIHDTLGATPLLIALGTDSTTFHVWDRTVQGQVLRFERQPASVAPALTPASAATSTQAHQPVIAAAQTTTPSGNPPAGSANPPGGYLLTDNTGSTWDFNGKCLSGPLKDQQLQPIQSYQEFWHSWSNFHPGTGQYVSH